MMETIKARNTPEAYTEALQLMRLGAKEYPSRNGPVMAMPCPVMLEITNPLERVLFDPIRQANPYFHVMEFIWVMAGQNDVAWLEQFNARYRSYAEDDGKVHGAYGYRWINHFKVNQLLSIVQLLRDDPSSRRGVVGMWDPASDLQDKRDLPCNTHIYFRVIGEKLEMTVCNRSNDLIWGMLGANVVVFTMLQQLIAESLGRECGPYRVFTNNLHMYESLPKFAEIWQTRVTHDPYRDFVHPVHSLLTGNETLEQFLLDAKWFLATHTESLTYTDGRPLQCEWFRNVARPMRLEYKSRQSSKMGGLLVCNDWIEEIQDDAWRRACELWEEWHE
jgi:hypothetical protein